MQENRKNPRYNAADQKLEKTVWVGFFVNVKMWKLNHLCGIVVLDMAVDKLMAQR